MNKRAARCTDEGGHQIILAARVSGLNDFEYCRTNSISRSTLYRTLARLRQKASEIRMSRRDRIREICPCRGPISADSAQSDIADDRCVCDVSEVHQLHAAVLSGKYDLP